MAAREAIHPAVCALLERGREAVRRGDSEAARRLDAEALDRARAEGDRRGEVHALRLLGLLAYRRRELDRARRLLEEARERARDAGLQLDAAEVAVHLGPVLRHQGELDEADAVFHEALGTAVGREHLALRARLLSGYGAFLDALGNTAAAAEHYGRAEELFTLLAEDDPGHRRRLANARGLVSRASRRQRALNRALVLARQEVALAREAGDARLEARGWMHEAQALQELGRWSAAGGALDAAAALFDEGGRPADRVRIAQVRSRFHLRRAEAGPDAVEGDVHEAWRWAEEARRLVEGAELDGDVELRAGTARIAAEVAARVGLHGEALHHLAVALELELRRFASIRPDARLGRLARGRREELHELARRVQDEMAQVVRAEAELERVRDLLGRLDDALGHDGDRPASPLDGPPAWKVEQLRERAEARWRLLLGRDVVEALPASVRRDLSLADVVGVGPVEDLPRSFFLVIVNVEWLLHRLFYPGSRKGLGGIVHALRRREPGGAPIWGHDDARIDSIRERAGRLRQGPARADGRKVQVSPIELRNRVAHGGLGRLDRLDFDAARRVVTVGPEALLPELARMYARRARSRAEDGGRRQ